MNSAYWQLKEQRGLQESSKVYWQRELWYKMSSSEDHSKGKLCAQADVGDGGSGVKEEEKGPLGHIRGITAWQIWDPFKEL